MDFLAKEKGERTFPSGLKGENDKTDRIKSPYVVVFTYVFLSKAIMHTWTVSG